MSDSTFKSLSLDAELELDFAQRAKGTGADKTVNWALRRAMELFCAAAAIAPTPQERAAMLKRAHEIAFELNDPELAKTLPRH
jgi:hypothetical protein